MVSLVSLASVWDLCPQNCHPLDIFYFWIFFCTSIWNSLAPTSHIKSETTFPHSDTCSELQVCIDFLPTICVPNKVASHPLQLFPHAAFSSLDIFVLRHGPARDYFYTLVSSCVCPPGECISGPHNTLFLSIRPATSEVWGISAPSTLPRSGRKTLGNPRRQSKQHT